MRAYAVALTVILTTTVVAAQPLAITHVTVIDTTGGASQQDVTVVIDGGRIAAVERGATAPKNATVVDGRGKFLIPGLWDMHVHLSWTTSSALPILLANGVTGVRDLGGSLAEIDGWRARIAAGTLSGPHILRVGPMLNGQSFNRYQLVPGNIDATRGVARALKFIGVDFIEVHRHMATDSYVVLMDEIGNSGGIEVVGDIPMTLSPEDATNSGQATVEHVATLFEGTFAAALKGRNEVEAIREWRTNAGKTLFNRFAANHTSFDPTLVAHQADETRASLTRYVARSLREEGAKRAVRTDEEYAVGKEMFAELKEVVRLASQRNVTVLAGSDVGVERVPGFSLHDELALLVDCGLTPMQALRAATLNAATVIKRRDDFGTVAVGKVADLVLLDADPLVDIHNTQRISAVVFGGKLLRRSALDALLHEGEALAAQH